MAKTDWLPKGNHVLTPYLTVSDAKAAIDFYIQAFGAKEVLRLPSPDGQKLMHAELQLGDSMLMLADAFPEMGGSEAPSAHSGSPVTVHMYVADTDATVARAEAFGAKVTMPPADMFWGDRFAKLKDPFGHNWSIATNLREVPTEEMAAAIKKMGP
jgi:PhnB protein